MPARILIVEDEPLVASDIEQAVQDGGLEVIGLARGVGEALAVIERESIDLVLLDANLHGRSAAPVAERLRAKGVPFIALSGYSAQQLTTWLGSATSLISKPCAPARVVHEIHRVLGCA